MELVQLSKEFTEDELDACRDYAVLISEHEKCDGSGIMYIDGQVTDCDCRVMYYYIREMMYARLPSSYWKALIDKPKMKVENQEAIDQFFTKPKGSIVVGGFETIGKTQFLVMTGKKLLQKNIRTIFMDASDLVRLLTDKDLEVLQDRVSGCDVILIDDFHRLKLEWKRDIVLQFVRKRLGAGTGFVFAIDSDDGELYKLVDKSPGGFFTVSLFEPRVVDNFLNKDLIKEAREMESIDGIGGLQ